MMFPKKTCFHLKVLAHLLSLRLKALQGECIVVIVCDDNALIANETFDIAQGVVVLLMDQLLNLRGTCKLMRYSQEAILHSQLTRLSHRLWADIISHRDTCNGEFACHADQPKEQADPKCCPSQITFRASTHLVHHSLQQGAMVPEGALCQRFQHLQHKVVSLGQELHRGRLQLGVDGCRQYLTMFIAWQGGPPDK